jgi:hypothetical protein
MDTMMYVSPRDGDIYDPPPDLLYDRVFRRGEAYFAAGWGGAALHPARHTPDGFLIDLPSLEFWYIESGGFFLRYQTPDGGLYVPDKSRNTGQIVTWRYGGEPMPIPVDCLVPRQTAWEIVQHFCETRMLSLAVQWVDWNHMTIDWRSWRATLS